MSYTVYANSKSVCTKGTPDAGFSAADQCFTVDGILITVPNVALTSQLGAGKTSAVKIAGQPVWIKTGELDAKTLYPHPGINGGKKTGTYIDKCLPNECSPNVLMEGAGVVRMGDATKQNAGNCDGVVMPAALAIAMAKGVLADALAGLAKERKEREEAARKAEEARKAAEEAAKKEEEKKKEQEEQKDEWCKIDSAKMTDSNSRAVSAVGGGGGGGTLEVVPGKAGETISLDGALVGDCPDEPEWSVSGYYSHSATGTSTSFRASSWSAGLRWLGDISSRTANATFKSSVEERSFTLKTYPADKWSLTLQKPKTLAEIEDKLKNLLGFFLSDWDFKFFEGSASIEAGWEEDAGSPVAFYAWKIQVGFNPIIAAFFKCPLVGNTLPKVLQKYLGEGGIGAFLTLEGGINVNGSAARSGPNTIDGEVGAEGYVTLTLSLEIKLLNPKVLEVVIGVSGTITLGASLVRTFGTAQPRVKVQGNLGPVAGFANISAAWGLINFKRSITIIAKKPFINKDVPLFKE